MNLTREHPYSRLLGLLAATALWSLEPVQAAAQACAFDAGCADAGSSDASTALPDAATPDAGASDGGTMDASGGDASAADAGDANMSSPDAGPPKLFCSCDNDLSFGGEIHLCTGNLEPDSCDKLACNTGTARAEPCAPRGVLLCCDMHERGLYTYMYEDCTHPNCEPGFRAQCRDFGGSVVDGACEVGDSGVWPGGGSPSGPGSGPDTDDDDDSDLGCSVGAADRASPWNLCWLVLGGLFVARRRLRAPR